MIITEIIFNHNLSEILHVVHQTCTKQNNSISYFFSSQFGSFLIHCLNGLCILLSNYLALHLQSGRHHVGEKGLRSSGRIVNFWKGRGGKERGGESSTIMNHTSDTCSLQMVNNWGRLWQAVYTWLCTLACVEFRGFAVLGVSIRWFALLNSQLQDTVVK